jgi:hypothetical protein
VIGFAMRHAADVRTAFRCLDRFGKLINDVISPIIDERGDQVVFRRTEPPRIARLAALAVAAPVGTVTLLRELTGLASTATVAVEAAFQHPPPANADRYQAELGCPVHFNAPEVRLVLRRDVFDLALRAPDPGLSPTSNGTRAACRTAWVSTAPSPRACASSSSSGCAMASRNKARWRGPSA